MNMRTKRGLKVGISCLLLLISSHMLFQTWAHMRDQAHTNEPSARKRPKVVANLAPGGIDSFYRMLNLTEDQRPRIELIMTSARNKLGLVRNDATLSPVEKQAKIRSLMEESLREMHSILRPDQQQKLDQFHKTHMQ